MVGSPYQTTDNLVEDLLFLKELNPHMVGIGPLFRVRIQYLLMKKGNFEYDRRFNSYNKASSSESPHTFNNSLGNNSSFGKGKRV